MHAIHGKPVLVRGVLYVDPGAKNGNVLLLEADRVEKTGDPPVVCSVDEVLDLPAFDFFWLEELDYQEKRGTEFRIPESLSALEGKRVRVEGFVMNADPGPVPSFLLARSWWNGCCEGKPPTPFNSVAVVPLKGTHRPPPWLERASYAGVLRLVDDPRRWNRDRVVRLENAVRAPELGTLELHLPVWFEIALAGAVLALIAALRFASQTTRRAT